EYIEAIRIDEVKEPLFVIVSGNVGSGSFQVKEISWSDPSKVGPPYSKAVEVVTSAQYGEKLDALTVEPAPSDHVSLGLGDVELDPIEKAHEAIEKLQEALNQIDEYRSQYGALTNRFESAISQLNEQTTNLTSAQSRIMDADYAEESVTLARSQILQQAGVSMLAQANATPQSLISLIE
ncbi:MAG TPA: hypothetical protein DCX04_00375, partial [Halomonas sp.]|nr:hypothetical protein [Halomonas sp.]